VAADVKKRRLLSLARSNSWGFIISSSCAVVRRPEVLAAGSMLARHSLRVKRAASAPRVAKVFRGLHINPAAIPSEHHAMGPGGRTRPKASRCSRPQEHPRGRFKRVAPAASSCELVANTFRNSRLGRPPAMPWRESGCDRHESGASPRAPPRGTAAPVLAHAETCRAHRCRQETVLLDTERMTAARPPALEMMHPLGTIFIPRWCVSRGVVTFLNRPGSIRSVRFSARNPRRSSRSRDVSRRAVDQHRYRLGQPITSIWSETPL